MSWKIVEVKSDKVTMQGHLRGLEIQFPNKIKEAASISVDGKTLKVESWVADDRDDIVHVMLADAGAKEKSDDKPSEGSNTN